MLGWPEGVLHMTLPDFLLRCHPDDVDASCANVFESFSAEDAGGHAGVRIPGAGRQRELAVDTGSKGKKRSTR